MTWANLWHKALDSVTFIHSKVQTEQVLRFIYRMFTGKRSGLLFFSPFLKNRNKLR